MTRINLRAAAFADHCDMGLPLAIGVPGAEPGVDLLLGVDREYRDKARGGSLPRIAPRRCNAEGKTWLPVLHTRYGPWHFTALFSNTERAHELHRTYDWVVIHFTDPDGAQGQATVVTETRGTSRGKRVVRGREPQCARYYRSAIAEPSRATRPLLPAPERPRSTDRALRAAAARAPLPRRPG
ncbi:MAG TPA: hypothetical protein VGJ74_03295 [Burkholderiales bacterium]